MDFLGINWVGVDAENGRKLLLSLVFIAIVVITSRLLRGLVSLVLRRVDHATVRTRFWTRQAISLVAAIILILGLLSIWFSDPSRLATAAMLMSAGLAFALQQPVTSEHRDKHQPADPLGEHELPAEQQIEDDPQLQHQVSRSEQEGDARDERRALLEQRPHDRGRCVGAARARRARQCGDRDLARSRAPERATHLVGRHDRLKKPREGEAQHQASARLPEHAYRHRQRASDPGQQMIPLAANPSCAYPSGSADALPCEGTTERHGRIMRSDGQ